MMAVRPGRRGPIACVLAAATVLCLLLSAAGWEALRLGAAWREGTPVVTVLFPGLPTGAALEPGTVADALRADPDAASVAVLAPADMARLLGPYGVEQGWPLPATLEVTLRDGADTTTAAARLGVRATALVPGAITQAPSEWRARVAALGRTVGVLALAGLAAAAAIMVAATALATQATLSERWPGVIILHGLGATDAQIARGVAAGLRRAAVGGIAAGGAIGGALLLAAAAVSGNSTAGVDPGLVAGIGPGVATFALAAGAAGVLAVGVASLTAHAAARARLRRLP